MICQEDTIGSFKADKQDVSRPSCLLFLMSERVSVVLETLSSVSFNGQLFSDFYRNYTPKETLAPLASKTSVNV